MMKFPNLVLPLVSVCLACGLRKGYLTNNAADSATVSSNALVTNVTVKNKNVTVAPPGSGQHAVDGEAEPCFTCPGSFTFIQLADPQFGMKNMAQPLPQALNFDDERSNLNAAVQKIKKLFPRKERKEEKEKMFVVMSGDMQNFWSQQGTQGNNMALKEYRGTEAGYPVADVGKTQALAVKNLLHELQKDGIIVWTLPGNHDLDDKMNMEGLHRYKRIWKPSLERSRRFFKDPVNDVKLSEKSDYFSFWFHEVMFIAINSQLYFTDDDGVDEDVREYRDLQTKWIATLLKEAKNRPAKAVVVLSHIPPFVGRYHEKSGWANWHVRFRKEVLEGTMYDPENPAIKSPQLILCGHFHGNVRVTGRIFEKPVEVVTSGSVGATMLWDGGKDALDNEYLPTKASEVAEESSGGLAFFNHIVLTEGVNQTWMHTQGENEKYSNIPNRITTDKSMSGLRIVQFSSDGGYRHKWFTLKDFTKLPEPFSKFSSECMEDSYSGAEISSESFTSDDAF